LQASPACEISKKPLFEKSGAKTFITSAPGISNANGPD
jgi:hypothetical protein